jgi:hypothetical protein
MVLILSIFPSILNFYFPKPAGILFDYILLDIKLNLQFHMSKIVFLQTLNISEEQTLCLPPPPPHGWCDIIGDNIAKLECSGLGVKIKGKFALVHN